VQSVSKFNCKAHKEKTYMLFNALYGLKNTQTIKKNFNDLYVYKN